MLHITDGESVAGSLRQSVIPGKVAIYGDLMYEGPAEALNGEAWRNMRADFLAEAGYATFQEARQYLEACEEALADFAQHDEVVVWLDHRLSDQLILIRVLDWFSWQSLGDVKLSLICVADYPGRDRFVGLGELTADQLASLTDTRLQVTDAQFDLARKAWTAFTSPDPSALELLMESDTSALPFLANAFRRHLEQFPSVDGGLSRTERQALSILREYGALPLARLFKAVQSREEQIFMADTSFYRIIANLSVERHPVVYLSEGPTTPLSLVSLTEAGRKIVQGEADHIELNGVDRWLGGVHLKGRRAAWRWDRLSSRLVAA